MNGRRIAATVKMRIRTFYRSKEAVFFTFFFPVMLMVLFGLIFSNQEDTAYKLMVQNRDGSEISHNFTTMLNNLSYIDVEYVPRGADADLYMREHNGNFMIVIPEGYGSAIMARMMGDPNASAELVLKYDPSQSSAATKLQITRSILQEMNKALAGVNDTILAKPESITARSYKFIEYFIPGILGMTVMTSAVFGTIYDNNEFKQKGIARKLYTTPITRGEWVLSNMLYQLLVAIIYTALILIVGWVAFGAWLDLNIFLPLVIVAAALAFSGLGMLVGRAVKDAQSASALGNLITFPMMFLSGSFFPMEMMPDFLKTVAHGLPLYYVNESLREAMVFQNFGVAAGHLAVISVFAAIVFAMGVLVTKWKQD